jgi:hypothetical protein
VLGPQDVDAGHALACRLIAAAPKHTVVKPVRPLPLRPQGALGYSTLLGDGGEQRGGHASGILAGATRAEITFNVIGSIQPVKMIVTS